MKLFLLCLVMFLTGCGTLAPITTAFEFTEAVESKSKVDKTPDTIETVVTKKDGKIVVESSAPEHSRIPPIELPALETKLDIEKGLKTPPIWLYLLVLVSGTLFFINMFRRFVKNKKMRSGENDTDGIDNDGRWCSDGRSVQIHGQRTEEQAETTRDADANESAEIGPSERRQRVSIQVGRRSSE
jgi:hypothetical protein